MSLDRSLKMSSSMAKHRNVLTRVERIERLKEQGKFEEGQDDPIHLPKVGNRKIITGKKK